MATTTTTKCRLVKGPLLPLLLLLVCLTSLACCSDIPLQLVKPAANHRDLELVEHNLMLLKKLQGPVAIVAVVGKFHSGKSFLMNQLMGKSAGFGVGPSVQPKTMGIWMWGQPLLYDSPRTHGQKINLVFLDTEGFAANNVTENYDAKVFAVSTLMSSHLLYNSVKIIDQSDIDYLELLARRTQLFALRSQLSKNKWTDFNHDMLTFPPLTWVVQDFVQETHNFETPSEWLHRLMGGHSRESDNYTISLLDIFEKVDCHTLFIPAFDRELLTDLSKATDQDLSPDYRRERDSLIRKLKENVAPKEKGDQFVTGNDLAQLLRVLVGAANDGSLADVPSRWDTFVERLQTTASDDCTTFYNRELDGFLLGKHKNEPVSMRQFDLQHQQIKAKAFELLDQLLHGLDDALIVARRDLGTGIDAIFSTKRDLNDKKIKVKTNQIKSKLELVAEEQLKKINLPLKTANLQKQAESICSQLMKTFQDDISELVDPDTLNSLVAAFEKSLNLLTVSIQASNRKLIESALDKIKATVLTDFAQGISPTQGKIARKPSTLVKILDQMVKNSEENYRVKSVEFADEDAYKPALALFREELMKHRQMFITKNEEVAASNIKNYATKLAEKFTDRIKFSLPMDESTLNSRLSHEGSALVEEFETQFGDFGDCCQFSERIDILKQTILSIGHEKQQENVKAYKEVVQDVLKNAKDLIQLSQEKYGNQYSFRRYVTLVASKMLSEGKSASWDENLKNKVIDDFIGNDSDIIALMESKKGILASILGFLEYILTFIGF